MNISERKQFGYIYHLMATDKAFYNFTTDSIKVRTYNYISFTRDINLNSYMGDGGTILIKIELNNELLSDKYRIEPYRYRNGFGVYFDEFEERVVKTKTIENLHKYISKIILLEDKIDKEIKYKGKYVNYLLDSRNEYNIISFLQLVNDYSKKYDIDIYLQDTSKRNRFFTKNDNYIKETLDKIELVDVKKELFNIIRTPSGEFKYLNMVNFSTFDEFVVGKTFSIDEFDKELAKYNKNSKGVSDIDNDNELFVFVFEKHFDKWIFVDYRIKK